MSRVGADATSTSPSALRALGATWASRYLSDFPWKNLTPTEAKNLTAAGFDIVSNWENDVGDWATGQGEAFARRAAAQHAACGGPSWAPIYFSVDEKVDPSDPRLHQYFRDINSVLGVSRTGCYAQTSVLRALRSAGLIRFTWRSMSTFGLPEGLGNPGEFDIEQTGQFNTSYDRDVANSSFFGQWRVGAPAPSGAAVILGQDDLAAIWGYQIPRGGPNVSGGTTPGGMVSWNDQHVIDIEAAVKNAASGVGAKVDALAAALAKLTPAAPVDVAALAAAVVTGLTPVVDAALAAGQPVDYDHLAVVVESHLAATLTQAK